MAMCPWTRIGSKIIHLIWDQLLILTKIWTNNDHCPILKSTTTSIRFELHISRIKKKTKLAIRLLLSTSKSLHFSFLIILVTFLSFLFQFLLFQILFILLLNLLFTNFSHICEAQLTYPSYLSKTNKNQRHILSRTPGNVKPKVE